MLRILIGLATIISSPVWCPEHSKGDIHRGAALLMKILFIANVAICGAGSVQQIFNTILVSRLTRNNVLTPAIVTKLTFRGGMNERQRGVKTARNYQDIQNSDWCEKRHRNPLR
jgi:hypothetical protein